MATCNLHWGVYIVGQAGTSNTTGPIIYTVFLYASTEILNDFVSSLFTMFDDILVPLYNCTTMEELEEKLPETLTSLQCKLIRSRWPFFTLAHSYVVPNTNFGFPACSVMKTAVQALYNSLKGGLDANTQQFQAIQPPIKTGFVQNKVSYAYCYPS